MAANLKEAVANFQATAQSYQAMFDLASELDALGDIKQATAKAKTAKDIAEREAVTAQSDLESAKTEAAQTLTDSRAKAKAEADRIVGDTQAAADARLAEATAKAQKLVDDATATADTITAKADAAKLDADEAEGRAHDARAELALLEERIAKAKASIATIMAGA